jgi:hypothetical protein
MKNVYYCSFYVLPGQMTAGCSSEGQLKMADITINKYRMLKIKI